MGIIAWIILGLVAGMVATNPVPGRDRHGLIITTLPGIAGALLGGFLATQSFHVNGTQGFFNPSTWITAIIGTAVLTFAYHLVTGPWRPSGRPQVMPQMTRPTSPPTSRSGRREGGA